MFVSSTGSVGRVGTRLVGGRPIPHRFKKRCPWRFFCGDDPTEEMEKRGLVEGQLVGFDPIPVELRPVEQERTELRPDVRAAAERVWAKNEAGLRYLAGR